MMKGNKTKSAFIIIDMENGFVEPESAHCIKNAMATVPALVDSIDAARKMNIPVFFVKRIYRKDGSDVELTRFGGWKENGKAMTPGSIGKNSAEMVEGLKPKPGDYSIIKPRWSAFFQTELDLILRRLGIRTVILTGTTTPNCVRTTAYDANALDYNVVVLEDCCSSQTEEIQRVNIEDMSRMGAVILNSEEFIKDYEKCPIADALDKVQDCMNMDADIPEPFGTDETNCGWCDRW